MKQENVTVGLELAKNVLHAHAIGRDGAVLVRCGRSWFTSFDGGKGSFRGFTVSTPFLHVSAR